MKKIIGIILIVVGIISTSIGAVTLLLFNVKSNVASSVAIIGGADGPTSIFIAGKIGAPMNGAIIVDFEAIIVGIGAFAIGLVLVLLKKKQDH